MKLWRYAMRKRVIILYLHGVMDQGISSTWVPLRPQYSRKQLDQALSLLSRHYRFISIDTARQIIAGEIAAIDNSMVLTFDDGYLNNWKHAAPILRKYGVPAVFYVATGNIEKREPFWVDRLDYAIQAAVDSDKEIVVNGQTITLKADSRESLTRSFKAMRDLAKTGTRGDEEMRDEIDQLIGCLESESGSSLKDVFEGDDWAGVMSWSDVQAAANDEMISVGSHTVDHVRLGEVRDDRASSELSVSKSVIESKTGVECQHFCYPNGSYNQRTPAIARQLGYRSAVTVEAGLNKVGSDPMTLRRIHLPDTEDELQILYVASGLSDAIDGIQKALSRRRKG